MVSIGIDLGTTNSLAAYWTEEGPKIIPNVFGSSITPSIVSVDDAGEIFVGEIARERMITHPAGDNFLGGEDFTEVLTSFIVEKCNIDIERMDQKDLAKLKKQAELCKRQLTANPTAKFRMIHGDKNYEADLDRNTFELMVANLVLKLRQPTERALRDASLKPQDMDAVVLIGGATRMPVIRNVVSKMFGRLPFTSINPDETVAMGAAIQAALKERNASLNEVILTDVCPYSLGVQIVRDAGNGKFEEGYFLPIIERNTPIPVSRCSSVRGNRYMTGIRTCFSWKQSGSLLPQSSGVAYSLPAV